MFQIFLLENKNRKNVLKFEIIMQFVDLICSFVEELISTTIDFIENLKALFVPNKRIYIQKQILNLPEFRIYKKKLLKGAFFIYLSLPKIYKQLLLILLYRR